MILPRDRLITGSQERRAWVGTQTMRTQHMLKMDEFHKLFAHCTYSMKHPEWVKPSKSDPLYPVTVGFKNQILSVPAYIPICSRKPCSEQFHTLEVLQPLLRFQEPKAMRVHTQNGFQPRPMLLYTSLSSTAYVQ